METDFWKPGCCNVITLSIWHKPEGIIPWKPTYSTWSNHTYGCMAVWIINAYFPCSLKADSGFLYESAMVDGAKQWTMFWKITLPMLTPTIFFNLILQIVNGFRVFTESYVITDGGPLDSTLSYVLYLYRRAFTYFDMGYSCALAWILVIIIAVFTIVLFKTQNNWVHYETGGDE